MRRVLVEVDASDFASENVPEKMSIRVRRPGGSWVTFTNGSDEILNCDTDTFGGIEHIRAILLELNLEPRYDNQPTKDDFDAFLDARGFACTFAYGSNSTDDHANLLYRRR